MAADFIQNITTQNYPFKNRHGNKGIMTKKSTPRLNTGADEQWNMIRAKAKKDRNIEAFPRAYRDDATPYAMSAFSPKVTDVCSGKNAKLTKSDNELNISKLILVGDVSVGKTSLVHKFCHDLFNRDYKATIGVDFEVERFDILDIPFTLQIWDTAGQERFRCIAASYYRGANVIVVVFDLSDLKSLESCKRWLDDAADGNNGTPYVFLVGTKRDSCSTDSFRRAETKAIETARELKAEYWAVSAKTGDNVQELFFRIASMAFDALLLREIDVRSNAPPPPIAPSIKLTRRKTPRQLALRLLRRTKCWKAL
ncbi:Ras-related protein Rab-36 [Hypsibius exemplaris]|uniref:Ras-related protein Rab-36 n=1 Tax=Hypsibius exemplaris TaxID=2072580 RepID=A0A9X6NNG9_HYPEX|nr:Ras-related protein Rab-36 [Hypsibius exemplaris]